ncbi:HrpE/YscL family type III secretion apparatus protein [Hahella sp. KA22]|uniref:type III secretion system stator protein SctL n=1 Tax=Hahella sp. KA22 TaxID=1628392 RepID=UPI000FDECC81|nr:type III secretion system stator protein SctL [Hahella sp. KA22]AZZ92391.1 HrpE/YscL family type III secretion apparatus protein [Hahella sp. KA22]QAY55765.1 HrpE/YscL family type III secretion apparatus protein [Hahella sp. KA22]
MEANFILIRNIQKKVKVRNSLIKAFDYQSWYDADRLIDAARAEADAILADAKRRAQEVLEHAYQDGLAKAKEESAERLVTASMRAHQMLQMAESDLIELVKLSVEKLFGDIGDEVKIASLIESGLASLREDYRVTVHVAPEMEAQVKAALPDVLSHFPGIEYFDITADPRLSRDAYVLQGDAGIIKGSISDRFAKLNTLVEQALAAPQN